MNMETIQPSKSAVPAWRLPAAGRSDRPQYLSATVPFLSFIFCLLSFTACNQEKYPAVIIEATPFSLTGADSVQYNLTDYRGKVVLLNFWADWCPHCRKEFAKLQQANDELKRRGLEILAVNVGQSREHISELRQEYALTFPLLMDEKKEIAGKYGVTGLPVSFFIDRKGFIREKLIGWLNEEQIKLVFERIQAGN
jgi:peroxiredoxin